MVVPGSDCCSTAEWTARDHDGDLRIGPMDDSHGRPDAPIGVSGHSRSSARPDTDPRRRSGQCYDGRCFTELLAIDSTAMATEELKASGVLVSCAE